MSVADAELAVWSVSRAAADLQGAATRAIEAGKLKVVGSELHNRILSLAADTQRFLQVEGAPLYYNRLPGSTVDLAGELLKQWMELGKQFTAASGEPNPVAPHWDQARASWMQPSIWPWVLVGALVVAGVIVYLRSRA